MTRCLAIGLAALCLSGAALAQTPESMGDAAKAVVGTWEFSNADRDKTCSVTFKSDPVALGHKIEFDSKCGDLFPLVRDIVAWKFPENDLLYLVDAQGKSVVEFSEVEDGIYEAPTPGVGVLFLQNAAAAAPSGKSADQMTGDWTLQRAGKPLCAFTLTMDGSGDGYALTVKPGCDAAIARLNLTRWRMDSDQLMLVPARGNPWRFEEGDANAWRRVPDTDQITLVRQ